MQGLSAKRLPGLTDPIPAVVSASLAGKSVMARNIVDGLFESPLARGPLRILHRFTNRNRRRNYERAVRALRDAHDKTKEEGLGELAKVYAVGLYLVLLEHDFATLRELFVFADDDHRRKFAARQMALLLFEASNDIPKLLVPEYLKLARELQVAEEKVLALEAIGLRIDGFWKTHREKLGRVRNLVTAHRHKDGRKQLRVLDTMDPWSLIELGGEFNKLLHELVSWHLGLTNYTNFLINFTALDQFLRDHVRLYVPR